MAFLLQSTSQDDNGHFKGSRDMADVHVIFWKLRSNLSPAWYFTIKEPGRRKKERFVP